MTTTLALLGAALLLVLAALVLLGGLWTARARERGLVAARLDAGSAADAVAGNGRTGDAALRGLWERLRGRLGGRSGDVEMDQLLRQAGVMRSRDRVVLGAALRVFPWAVLALALVVGSLSAGGLDAETLTLVALIGLAAIMVPRRLLAARANARQERIAEQVGILVQLLRLLFDSGQSVESALRVVTREGRELAPDLGRELEIMLQRVESGLALPEALAGMADGLGVPELDDAVAILRQLVQQGGGAREPFGRLADLIEDRQQTRVQEKVSRMSAKMSIVMMLFLFPALIAVLAAPGFISLMGALGGIGD